MGKLITMDNFERQRPKEIGVRHDCTVVVFCDDTGRDVWENEKWLVTFPGQTIHKVAKKYAFMNQNFLFGQHRRLCVGENPRKHSVTVRFEVDNFAEIQYVSLGIDKWRH